MGVISLVSCCTDGKTEVQRGQSPTLGYQSRAGAEAGLEPPKELEGPNQDGHSGKEWLAPPLSLPCERPAEHPLQTSVGV